MERMRVEKTKEEVVVPPKTPARRRGGARSEEVEIEVAERRVTRSSAKAREKRVRKCDSGIGLGDEDGGEEEEGVDMVVA